MSGRRKNVIDEAKPHSIKKFELIEMYIQSWAQKLMQIDSCNGLIFIDCMCNCGVYKNEAGELIKGTAVRVSEALLEVARDYPGKTVHIYLNDKDSNRIEELKKHLPQNERNYQVVPSCGDAHELLRTIGPQLYSTGHLHYFLLYDPYDANIDWGALLPFFRNWGEVMINHMVSDSVRALNSAKKATTKEKYQNTYLEDFERLVPYGSDKAAYEKRVEEIIDSLKGERRYYVSAFPFYNRKNSELYNLILCTSNIEGFKLYKKCAWKVFGGQSSTKNSPESGQLAFGLDGIIAPETDESCFHLSDIAKYLQKKFRGQRQVPLGEMWEVLDTHPIFPSDGFRKEIKHDLVDSFGAKIEQMINPEAGKKETVITFSS
ncbi:three-Cys-motif partner protein [Eubacterium pyruvativorans]|uniref:Three-Cys-motif partner protein n=1 Tax=Eubacterium pyruvativorans TaxID=155865 RepID=A0A1I7HMF5_9FIRM|nr:three-Cys-motif partner protein TcmP [Eubacterium pyruvativorans]MDY4049570.1 three-Cys-motif partner protein TcmP [Eubacterium pyruvativorans]SFO29126.1 three-Cys-motif partner protein [Eubacterium pyruvativorans]SFU61862.1 three-Cys-motif partner protein [Eubacterium pyruvativorans]